MGLATFPACAFFARVKTIFSCDCNLATRLPCRSFSFRLFTLRLLSCSSRVLILILAVASSFEAARKVVRANAVYLAMGHKVTNM